MAQLHSYKGKDLKSVLSHDITIENAELKEHSDDNNEILTFIKNTLKDKVSDVKISKRLKESVGLIVNKTGLLEDTINAVNFLPQIKERILEININHPVLLKLKKLLNNSPKETLDEYVHLIYNIALMESNYNIDNPLEFKKMLINIIEKSLPSL
jgi:molecular chaperone HtpG